MEHTTGQPTLQPPLGQPDGLVGCRYLGPSGSIWTVRSITAAGRRVVLVRATPDGDAGIVIDREALSRMIPVPDGHRVADDACDPSDNVVVEPSDRVVA